MVRPCLVGLALLLGAMPSAAQRARPGFDVPPLLVPGQRVRVWTFGASPIIRTPMPVMYGVRFAGTLLAYDPPDSLLLYRTGPWAALSRTRERTVYWSTVTRIDEARGRDVLGGAAGGLAGAFGLALMGALAERAFGCHQPADVDMCTNVFKTTGRLAVFTVPAGAVVGFFSTRWKRVY